MYPPWMSSSLDTPWPKMIIDLKAWKKETSLDMDELIAWTMICKFNNF